MESKTAFVDIDNVVIYTHGYGRNGADVSTPHIPPVVLNSPSSHSWHLHKSYMFLFVWGKRNLQIEISLINIHIYFTWKTANTDVSQALRVIKTQLVGK